MTASVKGLSEDFYELVGISPKRVLFLKIFRSISTSMRKSKDQKICLKPNGQHVDQRLMLSLRSSMLCKKLCVAWLRIPMLL